MIKRISSFLLLFLLACSLHAKIVERDSMLHIYEFLADKDPNDVLIACDIDNTLAETQTVLGSDQWFYGMFQYYAQEKGISLEVIDPRTVVPFDKQTVLESVKKTGRLVIFTEECQTGSFAAQIAAIVADEAFHYLVAPIKRVNAPDTPVPYGVVLEDFWMPNEDKLLQAINEVT